jgi:hypothetical protein
MFDTSWNKKEKNISPDGKSAINPKLNASGHMLIWTFFLVLVCGTSVPDLFTPFSFALYSTQHFIFPHKNTVRPH